MTPREFYAAHGANLQAALADLSTMPEEAFIHPAARTPGTFPVPNTFSVDVGRLREQLRTFVEKRVQFT